MEFLQLISNDFMFILLSLIILGLSIWLYNLNNDAGNTIDLADLISDKGRIVDSKLIRFGTWIISSWGFIYLITKDNLTEWYFIGFMGSWVANALISKHLSSERDKDEREDANDRFVNRRGYRPDPEDFDSRNGD